ncbi:hypothetical protein H6G81_08620 [Scytonema hofmannii FACHB-248]|uniref:Uncharacterized protein n=1 Tax=Scytonema hofmannii FACHB-248 TaxID=1842502 RepID=A0ABR8GMN0_9CYAN|nr:MULTISPECIES: hypothetical protein [Nostocales]MBD2604593.1 hypothetical protein [Scytonema hofmannii FACHB-248]
MHQASLRKKLANTCFPQAVFYQSGKLRQVKNKSFARSPRQGTLSPVEVRHLLKEASISPCLQPVSTTSSNRAKFHTKAATRAFVEVSSFEAKREHHYKY